MGSLLSHDRDHNARRLLLFATLDTFEAIKSVAFDQAVTASKTELVLTAVTTAVGDTGALLLVNAQAAVDGLRQVQDRFFLPSRVENAGVRVPDAQGTDRLLSFEDAAAMWLRVLRNANHGFRGRQDRDHARDEALLVAHTGAIPAPRSNSGAAATTVYGRQ